MTITGINIWAVGAAVAAGVLLIQGAIIGLIGVK